jgi:hypothetical protein
MLLVVEDREKANARGGLDDGISYGCSKGFFSLSGKNCSRSWNDLTANAAVLSRLDNTLIVH